jgi:hypothetical protein
LLPGPALRIAPAVGCLVAALLHVSVENTGTGGSGPIRGVANMVSFDTAVYGVWLVVMLGGGRPSCAFTASTAGASIITIVHRWKSVLNALKRCVFHLT